MNAPPEYAKDTRRMLVQSASDAKENAQVKLYAGIASVQVLNVSMHQYRDHQSKQERRNQYLLTRQQQIGTAPGTNHH